MFFRILKRTFWQFYENLLKGLLINLFFSILLLAIFIVFFIKLEKYEIAFLLLFFAWHVCSPGIVYYLSKIVTMKEQKSVLSEIFEGITRYFLQGTVFFVINLGFFFLFYLAYNFYIRLQTIKILSLILAGISIWIAVIFILMQLYLIPILILDENKRIFISYKKALIMVLSAPFSSLFCMILISYFLLLFYPLLGVICGSQIPIAAAVISLFPIFFMPFFTFVVIMLLQINSTVLIYEKHNIMPDLKEHWEQKSMSNFFRPWEDR
ncbi:MAG: hypothetical protein KA120_06235 [Candidatus Goldbacteria bacterium]|nr:hypothetical protein [Candidatus Goldiibacteriota bacterium]